MIRELGVRDYLSLQRLSYRSRITARSLVRVVRLRAIFTNRLCFLRNVRLVTSLCCLRLRPACRRLYGPGDAPKAGFQ